MKASLISATLLLVFFYGCTKNITTVGPDFSNGNYIFTSSFEGPSWDGWISPGPPIVKVTQVAPAVGGKYSIFLKAKDAGAVAYLAIPAITGTHKYTLTFWGKATRDPGFLELFLKSGSGKINTQTQPVKAAEWTEYKIETEFTAVNGDSLGIFLCGSAYVVPQGYTYFDFIRLAKAD